MARWDDAQRGPWWGDGHTHSDLSDGLDSLAENAAALERYDQDFSFATDHLRLDVSRPDCRWEVDDWSRRMLRLHPGNLAEYVAACDRASSARHIVIPGLELIWGGIADGRLGAASDAHVLVRDRLERLPEPAFFKGRSLIEILRELRARGMAPFLAHIDDAFPWRDLDGTEFDGLELRYDIERREPPTSRRQLQYWERWLCEGKRIPLSAGSDCHQMDLWAGGAMRNVVSAEAYTPEAIRRAVFEGRSYLSATWHPDLYLDFGYEGIAPDSGGFTPWWRLDGAESRYDRAAMKPKVDALTAAGLEGNRGRVRRESFPRLEFSVDGHGPGETAEARDGALAHIVVTMNVPLQRLRLIGQGETVWQWDAADGRDHLEVEAPLPLRRRRYVRLEAVGSAGLGRDEYLLANPVYLQ